MAWSKLLLHPGRDDPRGLRHHVTPESAGWTYVGFEVWEVEAGDTVEGETPADREACLVFVAGRGAVTAGEEALGTLGSRLSPFEGSPWSVYLPPRTRWRVEAEGDVELAVCSAPALGGLPVRVIPPDAVAEETRGTGSNTRYVRNILPEGEPAESLLVVEVITPGGNWSSYPPHKHDRDAMPAETLLEETYYHRFQRDAGYAVQRVYTDDRSLDETLLVEDRDVVLVPRGYHPVGAAHGYDLYYLNVMAGPVRSWRFHNDPDHEWLFPPPPR